MHCAVTSICLSMRATSCNEIPPPRSTLASTTAINTLLPKTSLTHLNSHYTTPPTMPPAPISTEQQQHARVHITRKTAVRTRPYQQGKPAVRNNPCQQENQQYNTKTSSTTGKASSTTGKPPVQQESQQYNRKASSTTGKTTSTTGTQRYSPGSSRRYSSSLSLWPFSSSSTSLSLPGLALPQPSPSFPRRKPCAAQTNQTDP